MSNQDLQDFVQSEIAKGKNKSEIESDLLQAGWKKEMVDEALGQSTVPAVPVPMAVPISSGGEVTEKQYPITTLWIFKATIITIVISIVGLFFGIWFPIIVLAIPFSLIANPLIRRNFHYSVGDQYFVVDQGVISKKHFNLSYGVIQNVTVKQDVFDRIFGLATLAVENAAVAGGAGVAPAKSFRMTGSGIGNTDMVGVSKNKINIPGIRKEHVEALKALILERMKANEHLDTNSGI